MQQTTNVTVGCFSKDIPLSEEPSIDRSNLIDTLLQLVNEDSGVVFIDGEEGIGITSTLAQFCRAQKENTFALFVRPASRFAYSVEYLRLALAEQMYEYLFQKHLDSDGADPSIYQQLLMRVRQRKGSKPIYFVVDGLHQIPSEDMKSVEQIFRDVLPIGLDFKFLITGDKDKFGPIIPAIKASSYRHLYFSRSETEKFLERENLDSKASSEIHQICRGNPGRIATVRRLLRSGLSARKL